MRTTGRAPMQRASATMRARAQWSRVVGSLSPSSAESGIDLRQSVTLPAYRANRIELPFRVELLPEPADENLDHVAVPVVVLLVKVIGELGFRDDAPSVDHQIFEQAGPERRELDPGVVHFPLAARGVQCNAAVHDHGRRVTGRAPDERIDA